MKLTFTFIATCLFFSSLIGQTENTNNRVYHIIQSYENEIINIERFEDQRVNAHELKAVLNSSPDTYLLKSAQVEKQLLDSTISEMVDEATGKMIISGKSLYTYSSDGKTALEIHFNWNRIASSWVNAWKTESTYDFDGKKVQVINYNWDEYASKWVGSSKYEYTYNLYGKLTVTINYNWNESLSIWVGSFKREYTYDSNGKQTQYVRYTWNSSMNIWVGSNKTEYAYDSNGTRTFSINYSWDTNISQWVSTMKTEYAYDSNGTQTFSITYNWDKNMSQWVGSGKTEYTFDSRGIILLQYSYSWDTDNNKWIVSSKVEYSYDSNQNITAYADYDWDSSNNKWVGTWKSEYSYINGDIYLYDMDKYYTWNIYSNNWEISDQVTYYYSTHEVTGTLKILNIDLKIYPNPVVNGFHITGLDGRSTMVLTDVCGMVMFSKDVINNEYTSIDGLPNGIYFVKIITAEGSIVKKIVKR